MKQGLSFIFMDNTVMGRKTSDNLEGECHILEQCRMTVLCWDIQLEILQVKKLDWESPVKFHPLKSLPQQPTKWMPKPAKDHNIPFISGMLRFFLIYLLRPIVANAAGEVLKSPAECLVPKWRNQNLIFFNSQNASLSMNNVPNSSFRIVWQDREHI